MKPFPVAAFPKLMKPFPVAAFPGKGKEPFPVATFPGKGKDLSTPNMGNKVMLCVGSCDVCTGLTVQTVVHLVWIFVVHSVS